MSPWVVYCLLLIAIAGIGAYFIPANIFNIDENEVRRQKEMGEQNELLRGKIFSSLHILERAREHIRRLDGKKAKIAALTADGARPRQKTHAGQGAIAGGGEDAANAALRIARIDSVLAATSRRGRDG